jgi:hypothetical protein
MKVTLSGIHISAAVIVVASAMLIVGGALAKEIRELQEECYVPPINPEPRYPDEPERVPVPDPDSWASPPGCLYDLDTGKLVLDRDGKPICSEVM